MTLPTARAAQTAAGMPTAHLAETPDDIAGSRLQRRRTNSRRWAAVSACYYPSPYYIYLPATTYRTYRWRQRVVKVCWVLRSRRIRTSGDSYAQHKTGAYVLVPAWPYLPQHHRACTCCPHHTANNADAHDIAPLKTTERARGVNRTPARPPPVACLPRSYGFVFHADLSISPLFSPSADSPVDRFYHYLAAYLIIPRR